MDKTTTTTGGIGLGGALFLLFVYLQLTGEIAWSWWWVTAPLWAPAGAVVAVTAIIALVFGIVCLVLAPIDLVRRARRSHWRSQ